MKIMLCSFYTPGFPTGPEAATRLVHYAARHGYEFIVQGYADPARPASWSKIPLVLDCLCRADWVFYLDADALICDPTRKLEDFIDAAADLIIGDDLPPSPLNAGVFLIRSCYAAYRMLSRACGHTEFLDDPTWEQRAIVQAIQETPELRAKIVDHRLFNAFRRDYEEGMFVKHLAGPRKYTSIPKNTPLDC